MADRVVVINEAIPDGTSAGIDLAFLLIITSMLLTPKEPRSRVGQRGWHWNGDFSF